MSCARSLWLEPSGLLFGCQAADAVRAGDALPLAGGGGAAFALLRELGVGGAFVRAVEAPAAWSEALERLTARPPLAGLPGGMLVMGILNVTPDSFSDGGRTDPEAAIGAGRALVAAGAGLVDVGGESTRPGGVAVTPADEIARVLPVVSRLAAEGVCVSVDTRHAATMAAVLEAGATVINDVSALADPGAAEIVAQAQAPVVLMHMRGTPQTMDAHAAYGDVMAEVLDELDAAIGRAVAAGIGRERIIVDPGIGFAKTAEHNLVLLRGLPALANLGCRVLLGVSRKGFVGAATGQARADRRAVGSIVAALPGLAFGDVILRVHDVAQTVEALRMWSALHGVVEGVIGP